MKKVVLTNIPLPDDFSLIYLHHIHELKWSMEESELVAITQDSHTAVSHENRIGYLDRGIGVNNFLQHRLYFERVKASLDPKRPSKPSDWSQRQYDQYLERRAFYYTHGDRAFFRKYFPRIYQLLTNINFWGTHKL